MTRDAGAASTVERWQEAVAHLQRALDDCRAHAAPSPRPRLCVRVRQIDIPALLAHAPVFPKALFWSERSQHRICGFGALERCEVPATATVGALLSQTLQQRSDAGPPWLGAARFSPAFAVEEVEAGWRDVGGGCFFRPRLTIEKGSEDFLVTLFRSPERDDEVEAQACASLLHQLSRTGDAPDDVQRPALDYDAEGERQRFLAGVARALACFADRSLDKVVLARRTEHEVPQPTRMLQRALHHLCENQDVGAAYFFAFSPRVQWFGKSPELLLHQRRAQLDTEAVAGTRRRGDTPEHDTTIADALLTAPKDLWEHTLVREHIEQVFQQFQLPVSAPPTPHVRHLSRVMHLVTPITAASDDTFSAGELVDALHPTPAIAGKPTNRALHFIREHEGFDRGLYAGPVGMIHGSSVELWVALRGARLCGPRLTLYAGAGLVDGSSPAAEWEETEAKTAAMYTTWGGLF